MTVTDYTTPPYDLIGAQGQILFTPHILGGGIGGVNIVRGDVQSEVFTTTVEGWRIRADGTVEFNDGVFRGELEAGEIHIPDAASIGFHVDTAGDLWIGANENDKATAPFFVDSATGDVRLNDGSLTGSLTVAGEIVIDGATQDLLINTGGIIIPASEESYSYGAFDIQFGDVRWVDGNADVMGFLRIDDAGTASLVAAPEGAQIATVYLAAEDTGLGGRAGLAGGGSISTPPASVWVERGIGGGTDPIVEVFGYPGEESMHTLGSRDQASNSSNVSNFTAESTVVQSNEIDLRAGRRYKVEAWVTYNVDNADTRVNASIDLSSGTSSITRYPSSKVILTPGATTSRTFHGTFEFEVNSGVSTLTARRVRLRLARRDGSGNINTFSSTEAAFITVEEIGPASYNQVA